MERKAWCPELDKLMTASDVWDYFFIHENESRKLTFLCPDQNCGARMVLKNCIRILSPSCASFRMAPHARHKEGCPMGSPMPRENPAQRLKQQQDDWLRLKKSGFDMAHIPWPRGYNDKKGYEGDHELCRMYL